MLKYSSDQICMVWTGIAFHEDDLETLLDQRDDYRPIDLTAVPDTNYTTLLGYSRGSNCHAQETNESTLRFKKIVTFISQTPFSQGIHFEGSGETSIHCWGMAITYQNMNMSVGTAPPPYADKISHLAMMNASS